MCCYREIKNFERFARLIQSIALCTLRQLQEIQQNGEEKSETAGEPSEGKKDEKEKPEPKAEWTQPNREKLFHLFSKVFLLNFPLYIALKHSGAVNPLTPVKVF